MICATDYALERRPLLHGQARQQDENARTDQTIDEDRGKSHGFIRIGFWQGSRPFC
jgi:hypothetical protein